MCMTSTSSTRSSTARRLYVMDRGYLDYARLYPHPLGRSFLVTRAKSNLDAAASIHPTNKQTASLPTSPSLSTAMTPQGYPALRASAPRPGHRQTLVFLQPVHPVCATICASYKSRWQIELFFKWIKQHLRIRPSTEPANAVKTNLDRRHGLCAGRIVKKRSISPARSTFAASHLSYFVRKCPFYRHFSRKTNNITAN